MAFFFNRFDDSDSHPGMSGHGISLVNGASPLKRKKLFDCSDDSDWIPKQKQQNKILIQGNSDE